MPTYSYRCTECGNAFDIQQSFDDAPLTECPSCTGRLRKLWGSVGVTFNGSGFYRTDSRAESRAGTASGGGADGGGSGESASPPPAAPAATPALKSAAKSGSKSGSKSAPKSGGSSPD